MKNIFKRLFIVCIIAGMLLACLAGCGDKKLEDGSYSVKLSMEGGTGKAYIESPVIVTVKDGVAYATLVWSSKNYDYMLVNGDKYLNESEGGNSTFTVPIDGIPSDMQVIGDTTAMSVPHEIEYTLHFEMDN